MISPIRTKPDSRELPIALINLTSRSLRIG
jgi:hypothetical protein